MFYKNKFLEYEKFFNEEHNEAFQLLQGKSKVMISAPHSVEQTRNGELKFAEPQTGIFAKMLHDELDCHVIYKTKNCGDDANFDENCSYKNELVKFIKQNNIKFLIDLHQLSPTKKVKIELGTGKLKNISNFEFINILLKAFTSKNIGLLQIDKTFTASYPFTVCSYVSKECGISCIQIEMHSDIVRFGTKISNVKKVYTALEESVIEIEKYLNKE